MHPAGPSRRTECSRTCSRWINNADALALDSRLLLAEGKMTMPLPGRRRAPGESKFNRRHFAQGRIHLARRELEPARRQFVEVLSLDPGSLEARLEVSRFICDRREIDSAIQVAREAVRVHPNSVDARLAVVRALLVRPEDHPEALREAQAVVAAYPSSAPARATLGDYFLATRRQAGGTERVRAGAGDGQPVFRRAREARGARREQRPRCGGAETPGGCHRA